MEVERGLDRRGTISVANLRVGRELHTFSRDLRKKRNFVQNASNASVLVQEYPDTPYMHARVEPQSGFRQSQDSGTEY